MLPFIVGFAGIGAALAAGALQRRWARLRQVCRGLLVSYVTLALILGGAEAYLRCCFADSENIISLATENWLARHWHTNALGFRDREWTPADWEGRTTVIVLGDSFAAGWGIADPADRFSDVLAARLGDRYAVMNLGVYGTATPEQLEILKNYPLKHPDVVILQYFLNDINYAGLKLGLLPTPPPTPAWVQESHLVNFLYWRLLVPSTPQSEFYQRWWEWSYAAYDNVGIWSVHQQEINEFADYVQSIGARLIVVIFPNLTEIVRSIPYVDRVEQAFQARGVTDILKLFDDAAAWPADDLMVSRRDSHASVNFNHHVGETLYRRFFAP